jgi:hypothetical protein
MDSVARFAEEALQFCAWAQCEQANSVEAVTIALVRISSLYREALMLPRISEIDDRLQTSLVEESSSSEACKFLALTAIPFDLYSEVFDPLELPGGESGVGSLYDDVADIYRDVSTGLVAWRDNDSDRASWEWRFSFYAHWGKHATGAMRALHAWLSAEGFKNS